MAIRIEDLPMKYQEQAARKQLAAIRAGNPKEEYASTKEMMQKYERHQRATQSNAEGHHFEAEIKKACKWYSANGRASVEKTPESFRVTRLLGAGRFEGRFTGKAQVDFSGVLKGGRTIKFDAKYTEKDRIAQNVLTKHQADELEEAWRLGAFCGVCVGMRDGAYFVPWDVWRDMKGRYGRKYITTDELEEYRLNFNIHSWALFLDYSKEGTQK